MQDSSTRYFAIYRRAGARKAIEKGSWGRQSGKNRALEDPERSNIQTDHGQTIYKNKTLTQNLSDLPRRPAASL